jgi:hypothetical protein
MAGHLARMVRIEPYINTYIKFWSDNLKRKYQSEDLGVNERIILEWILGKLCIGFIWLKTGINVGL